MYTYTYIHKYTTYATSASSANCSETQANKAFSFFLLSYNIESKYGTELIRFLLHFTKVKLISIWVLFSVTMPAVYILWIKLHLKYNPSIIVCMYVYTHPHTHTHILTECLSVEISRILSLIAVSSGNLSFIKCLLYAMHWWYKDFFQNIGPSLRSLWFSGSDLHM